jgi:hypothetical protein
LRGAIGSRYIATLSALAAQRPVFHSEHDFQHALARQIQLMYPNAHVRLEPRPRRGIHLDLLVRLGGGRTAIELKSLVDALHATVNGELSPQPVRRWHQPPRRDQGHHASRGLARRRVRERRPGLSSATTAATGSRHLTPTRSVQNSVPATVPSWAALFYGSPCRPRNDPGA